MVVPEVLHYIDSFVPAASTKTRNSIAFKLGDSTSIKNVDDNISDDFFELNLDDIKILHSDNVKKAREAEEGAQVSLRSFPYEMLFVNSRKNLLLFTY